MDTSGPEVVVVAVLLLDLLLSLSFPSVSPPVATRSESPFAGGLPPLLVVSDEEGDDDDDEGCFVEDCVELFVFGAAARAPGDDDTDDVVGLDCAGFTKFLLLLLLMHLPNALLLLILLFVLELFKFFADDVAAASRDECGNVPTFVDPIGPLSVFEISVS